MDHFSSGKNGQKVSCGIIFENDLYINLTLFINVLNSYRYFIFIYLKQKTDKMFNFFKQEWYSILIAHIIDSIFVVLFVLREYFLKT